MKALRGVYDWAGVKPKRIIYANDLFARADNETLSVLRVDLCKSRTRYVQHYRAGLLNFLDPYVSS